MSDEAFKKLVRQSFCKMDFKSNGDFHAYLKFGRVVIKGYWMEDQEKNPAIVGELIDILCDFLRKSEVNENE